MAGTTISALRRKFVAGIGITAAVLVTPLVVPHSATSATAASCPSYEFIGARGSGESDGSYAPPQYGMGDLVYRVYQQVAAAFPAGDVVPYGVHYPAVGLTGSISKLANAAGAATHISGLGAYTDSVKEGTADVQNEIERLRAGECGGITRVILSGYSQGAQATADALQRMPADDVNQIAAAAFFGDPYFNATSWADRGDFDPGHYGALGTRSEYPDSFRGRVFSYCHNNDPICNLSIKKHIWGTPWDVYIRDIPRLVEHGFTEHTDYATRGDDQRAAQDILDALGSAPPVPPSTNTPLDLVFAIDTTGSMGGVIDTVKQNVNSLVATLAETTSDYRFALVDYKDWVDEYQARLDVPFTADTAALQAGVDSLSAYGGGDYPESVYSGAMLALSQPWRPGVKKVVLVIGDAPPHDPEPVTGYTLSDVVNKALSVDPAAIDTLSYGNASDTDAAFAAMSDGTAGTFATPAGTSALLTALQNTLRDAGRAPVADAGGPYTATAGRPVALSAANTLDPFGHITSYQWDLDGDGVFDLTTDAPVITTTFGSAGRHDVTLRVTSSTGLSALAQASVTVNAVPDSAPAAPADLTATPGDGQITLTWQAGNGSTPDYYVIRDGNGSILDAVLADSSGQPIGPAIDPDLVNGVPSTYTVTAVNEAGESGSVSVTATPGGDVTPPTVGVPSFSAQPVRVGGTTTVTAAASDTQSGVVGGEVWIGSDPGVGRATPLTLSGGTLSGAISGLAAGTYQVGVRAVDAAGNWSRSSTALLVVYDPAGGFATGGGWIVPGGSTSDAGDALPGLDGTAKANFGFEVKYQSDTSTVPTGTVELHYNTAKFHLHFVGVQWLVVTDTQGARFRGLATIDGSDQTYPTQVDARDSGTSGTAGHLTVRVYAPGADPSTATPIYQASGDVTGGSIKFHS